MTRTHHYVLLAMPLGVLLVLGSGCSSPDRAPASHPPELWGDMKPVVSVKELMSGMLDPASDFIFDAIGTIITEGKVTEIRPKTDADWERVRIGAITIAEGVYLLKVPRPFAPEGDQNDSAGPEPIELTPAQIAAKREKDPVLWDAKIEALRNVSLEVLDVVKKRDAEALWDACDDLDAACENCHLEFWYPAQRESLGKADQRLNDLYGREHKTDGTVSSAPAK